MTFSYLVHGRKLGICCAVREDRVGVECWVSGSASVIRLWHLVLVPFEAETDESVVEHVPMLQQLVFHPES